MIEKKTLQTNHSLGGKRYSVPSPIVSFFLTALFLVALFAVYKFYPFGKYSVLQSDLSGQYAPNLIAFKNQLLRGSLQYSSLICFGKNTLGLFAYYLSSPLNLITFMFPTPLISEAVLTLIIIKLSLASAFMTLFLQKRHQTRSRFSVVFGVAYAFSSYAVVFMIHIMWLDGFFFLPLLLYCVEQFLEDRRRWKRLVIVLTVMFLSGFYIAYMVGIFSFFYLIFRLLEEDRFTTEQIRKTGGTIGKFIGTAVISAMLSAVIILPAGLDTLLNSDYTAKQMEFKANFTFLAFLNQLLAGSFDSLSHNNPLVYCGLFALFLCVLFFLNPSFSRRLKIITGAAIGIFVLSFSISYLNLAWHLFDEPNWFLFRYSFLLSFVMLSIAFRSFLHIEKLKGKAFLITIALFFLLLFVVQGFGDLKEEGARFYTNLAFGMIEIACLYALTGISFHESIANLKKLVPAFLALMLCLELVLVNPLFLRPKVFGGEKERSWIYDPIVQADPLVAEAKEDAKSQNIEYYRMETVNTDHSLDAISAALNMNFRSTSTFNSSSNKNLNRYLKQFGYMTNYNYFASSHSFASIVPDSLFGVRYLLSGDESAFGYDTMAESEDGTIFLLKNNVALPVLFEARSDAGSFDVYESERNPAEKDPFLFQNRYLQATFGSEAFSKPVYTAVNVAEPILFNAISEAPTEKKQLTESEESSSSSSSEEEDTDLLGEEEKSQAKFYETQYYRLNDQAPLKITYRFTVQTEDPIYFSVVAADMCGDAEIYVDDTYIEKISESFFTTIFSIGDREIGDTVTVELRSDTDQYAMIKTVFYSCDTRLFREQLAKADPSSSITIEKAEDGFFKAAVNTSQDALILSTIPYERGWSLLVDGERAEIAPYQDAFVSIPVTAGPHTIELSFQAPGIVTGGILSGTGLAVFIVACGIGVIRRKKK